MDIAVITGLYASEKNPAGGSFIHERVKELRKQNIPYHVYAVSRRYSKGMLFIYKHLFNGGLENHTILPWDDEPNFTALYDSVNLVTYVISLLSPKLYWAVKRRQLLRQIQSTSETIFHAHWAYPHGFCAVKLAQEKGGKSVITCHGSDIHSNPKISPLLRKITVDTIHSADKTIFVSNALLSSAKELGYDGRNAVVIPNGVNLDAFYPIPDEVAQKKLNWKPTKRYVVGFVGNLIPVKRADKFVEIFSNIEKTISDVEFVLIGDGELESEIRSECINAGLTTTFVGRIPHEMVGCWMNLFDVMILPSRNEGWPCVVLESYACGTPVVGADNGGISEALGGLCPSVSDGAGFESNFSDVVCQVLRGDYHVSPEKLRQHATEHTWENCMRKEIGLYNEVDSNNVVV